MELYMKHLPEESLLITEFSLRKYFLNIGEFVLTKSERLLWEFNVKEEYKELYNRRHNFVYIILYDNKIIKIGGSKVSIKGRIMSYKCGHCIKERVNVKGTNYPGKMSITNACVYNTIAYYLIHNRNKKFELLVYSIPDIICRMKVFGEEQEIHIQHYDSFEKKALDCYHAVTKTYPILCKNSHPCKN